MYRQKSSSSTSRTHWVTETESRERRAAPTDGEAAARNPAARPRDRARTANRTHLPMRPPTPRLDNSPISRGDEWPAGPFRAAPLTLSEGSRHSWTLWYLHQDGILSQVVLLSKVIGISILEHARKVRIKNWHLLRQFEFFVINNII
jgi:hypothetical protein